MARRDHAVTSAVTHDGCGSVAIPVSALLSCVDSSPSPCRDLLHTQHTERHSATLATKIIPGCLRHPPPRVGANEAAGVRGERLCGWQHMGLVQADQGWLWHALLHAQHAHTGPRCRCPSLAAIVRARPPAMASDANRDSRNSSSSGCGVVVAGDCRAVVRQGKAQDAQGQQARPAAGEDTGHKLLRSALLTDRQRSCSHPQHPLTTTCTCASRIPAPAAATALKPPSHQRWCVSCGAPQGSWRTRPSCTWPNT
jgi:hypothetical protein